MTRPRKPPLSELEAIAYARNHVERQGTVIAVSVVAVVLQALDRANIRRRELANIITKAGLELPPDVALVAVPPPDPDPVELAAHVPIRGRDACLVPACRCDARQAAESAG